MNTNIIIHPFYIYTYICIYHDLSTHPVDYRKQPLKYHKYIHARTEVRTNVPPGKSTLEDEKLTGEHEQR